MKTLNPITDDYMTPEREYSNLRDYFAAHAMQGMLTSDGGGVMTIVKNAYKLADAMVKERQKAGGQND